MVRWCRHFPPKIALFGAALFGFLALPVAAQSDEPRKRDPLINEQTGIALKLIDINVLDDEGRPMPGLTAADFELSLNSRQQEIYSVEDFCPAEGEPRGSTAPPAIPTHLYLDLAQIAVDGLYSLRRRLDTILDNLPEDTGPLVLAFNEWGAGLRRFEAADREAARTEILRAAAEPRAPDSFFQLMQIHFDECNDNPELLNCKRYADEHVQRVRLSVVSLARYMTSLIAVPGRKRVFYLHQHTVLEPQRLYGIADDFAGVSSAIRGTKNAAREIGAAALNAQVTIYPILLSEGDQLEGGNFGVLAKQAVNFSANLADASGGSFSRVATDLDPVFAAARRDVSCIYRIAIRLPNPNKSKIYNVAVAVRGELLPFRYALENLSAADAWMREAQAVLLSPDTAEREMFASIVPIRRDKRRWRVELVVEVDLAPLFAIPRSGEHVRGWTVGALLYDVKLGRSWEFLDRGETRSDDDANPARIQYSHALTKLPAGEYELRTFARDLYGNRFAAGTDSIVLPAADAPSALPPRFRTTPVDTFALPLNTGRKNKKERTRKLKPLTDPVPASSTRLGRQAIVSRLECGAPATAFTLAGESGPIEPAKIRKDSRGACKAIEEVYALEPGGYSYSAADGRRWVLSVLAEPSSPPETSTP